MKPRRTERSNACFTLEGGNEDNFLWAEIREWDGQPAIVSDWELTDEERERIAAGARVELWVVGKQHPPVSIAVGDIPT
jgi:hypothetical protein